MGYYFPDEPDKPRKVNGSDPPQAGEVARSRPRSEGLHRMVEAARQALLERLDRMPEDHPDGGWHNEAIGTAYALAKFAISGWTGYTPEQYEADYAAHWPTATDRAARSWNNDKAMRHKVEEGMRLALEAGSDPEPADEAAAFAILDGLVARQVEAGEEPGDPALRKPKITWASSIKPKPVTWAWRDNGDGRIPSGSLSVAAGREGTGKSSFGIWLTAQITKGLLPGAFSGEPRRVFYVAVEDSWQHTLVPRLIAAGADLGLVGRLDVVNYADEDVIMALPRDNALLEQAVNDHKAALVVIDPLMSVIGEKIDTHKERDVRSALDPLAKLADRTGAVILGIAHFNKGSGSDPSSLITGSGAFKNVPRSVFGFAKDEADENGGRIMSQTKNSLGIEDLPSLTYVMESASVPTEEGPAETGRFVFTGSTTERSVSDVLREAASRSNNTSDAEETQSAADWLREYLIHGGGQQSSSDCLKAGKATGFAESTIKNARRKVADSTRSGFGPGSVVVWVLKSGPAVIEP